MYFSAPVNTLNSLVSQWFCINKLALRNVISLNNQLSQSPHPEQIGCNDCDVF